MGTKCRHFIYIATPIVTSHGDHIYQCQRCRREEVGYKFRRESGWRKHTIYDAYISIEIPSSIAVDPRIEHVLLSRMNKRITDIHSKIQRLQDELETITKKRNSLIEFSNPSHPIPR